MLRTALAALLLPAALAALETPMIVPMGANTVVINPSLGAMTLYRIDTTTGIEAKLAVADFVADVRNLSQRIEEEQDGVPQSTLRLGSPNCEPTYAGLLTQLPAELSSADKKAGRESLRARVRRAEDAFWSAERKYDGVARVAVAGSQVGVLVPSYHALLVYEYESERLELKAWRTYGIELSIEGGMKTDPEVGGLLQRLPPDRRRDAIEAVEVLQTAAGGATGKDGKVAATPSGDAWLAGSGNVFAVLDFTTLRLLSYQSVGKKMQLCGVRNVGVDLALPGIFGDHLNSRPLDKEKLKAYEKSREKLIKAYGIDIDPLAIKALVGQGQAPGKGGLFNGLVSGSLLILDFTDRRMLATYDLNNGQVLKMVAVRDYTIDAGLAMLDQQFRDKEQAQALLEAAVRLGTGRSAASAMVNLRYALALDPTLYKKADQALNKALSKQADYQAVIDEAAKKTKELEEAAKARAKAVEEARRRAAGGN